MNLVDMGRAKSTMGAVLEIIGLPRDASTSTILERLRFLAEVERAARRVIDANRRVEEALNDSPKKQAPFSEMHTKWVELRELLGEGTTP